MKYMKYSLYILAVAFIAGGCKKELQQNNPAVFSDANAFTTFDHVQLGANGAFGRYSVYSFDMYANALTSDEAKIGADNNGQGALTFRYQYSADNTTGGDVIGGWAGYYSLIDQVNRVLPHVYTVTYTPAQAPRRDIVQGQLLALRALGHFGLLQAYCKNYNASETRGVPIMLASDPSAQPARNTMGQVMTQIEKDLADAKALLPAVTPATFTDTVMNKVNIAAYQARIALYKGDWANAITYATEVINSNVKPLVSGAAYTGIWTDANNNETLFRIRYATSTGIGALWTTTSGLIYIAPSDKLNTSLAAADVRKAAFIAANGAGNNYVNKFYTSSRGGRVVDMKACRISEMYLIRAEAYARQGAGSLALGTADLNALRAMRITGYVNEVFATTDALIAAVLDERFKELCFEGFRFYDLRRNNLPVQRLPSDASAAWQTLATGSFRFVFPIPQTEMTVNPNMVQNDGY
ncbi:MAG: RagB/SusD family nutrient uptake outer membrane protein [Chitinophagaceae bacterium]|nr:RagB/SusD family nutrient uptake outer membrane protein [Chitinophagaceae bacterium]